MVQLWVVLTVDSLFNLVALFAFVHCVQLRHVLQEVAGLLLRRLRHCLVRRRMALPVHLTLHRRRRRLSLLEAAQHLLQTLLLLI